MDGIEIPFMRTKRHHPCTSCRMRGEACIYANKAPATSPTAQVPALGTPSPEVPSLSRQSSSFASSPQTPSTPPTLGSIDVGDTELARAYLGEVVPSFADGNQWIWQVFVPSIAYSSGTVRHGMLTLGAVYLHFASGECNDDYATRYIDAANAHGNLFVRQSRLQLSRMDPTEVDSNLACTRLLCIIAFAFFRQRRLHGIQITSSDSWTWVHLVQGIKTVHESFSAMGLQVDPMLERDIVLDSDNTSNVAWNLTQPLTAVNDSARVLGYITRTKEARFLALQVAIDSYASATNDYDPICCVRALRLLQEVTDLICNLQGPSLFRLLLAWIGGLPQDFVSMVKNCHPLALAIYAHWLMLAILAEEHWWVGDMGRSGIQSVLSVVAEKDATLLHLMRCPSEVLNVAAGLID
ncbi:transcription factor [Recurvomyces mirabilis]|uniref:Transcription factor n=2 Tax=Recurvomyces mirabilis TaxID=574656 RepID=A0AAE0TLZ0_9PEZI|nr:transcription factor [Recurvomyces mirabilis]